MKVGLFGYEETCVKVYDPETKTLIGTEKTVKAAAQHYGISEGRLRRCCIKRGRVFSPRHNKELAFRYSNANGNNEKKRQEVAVCR